MNNKNDLENRYSKENPPERPAGSMGSAKMGGTGTPSDAPNASFETGTGDEATGFDSPPVASSTLSNPEYDAGGSEEAQSDEPPDEWDDVGPV